MVNDWDLYSAFSRTFSCSFETTLENLWRISENSQRMLNETTDNRHEIISLWESKKALNEWDRESLHFRVNDWGCIPSHLLRFRRQLKTDGPLNKEGGGWGLGGNGCCCLFRAPSADVSLQPSWRKRHLRFRVSLSLSFSRPLCRPESLSLPLLLLLPVL